MSTAGLALVGVLVTLGLVVVLPLGLRLLGPDVVPAPRSASWPLAGVAGAASLVLPRGPVAVGLALVLATATAVLLLAGVRHGVRALRRLVRDGAGQGAGQDAGSGAGTGVGLAPVAATVAALATPAVGASALVAERGGWGLLGFSGTYLALTVPHMLYAGFGAALVAGSVAGLARRVGGAPDPLATVGAWGVPLGTVLVLAGYFVGDVAELVGAVVLTGALWATAAATARSLARPGAATGPARALFLVGAASVACAMLLALWWAAGEAFGFAHPDLGLMAATHGVANALGFVLCTVLALRLLAAAPLGATNDAAHDTSTRDARRHARRTA